MCADADNCAALANPDQLNTDGDALGNACDQDDDGDTVDDDNDNCPLTANADQADDDFDGTGNACDSDNDNDHIADAADQCLGTAPTVTVDAAGCSIAQYCPQPGDWKNHGAYVRCVEARARSFVRAGLITRKEMKTEISSAASSKNGKKAGHDREHGKHKKPKQAD